MRSPRPVRLLLSVALATLLPAAVADAADTRPPTKPTALTVTATAQTSLSLRWDRSSDNVGVTGYRIYRNGTGAGTTDDRQFTLTGLSCGTTYIVAVAARDAAGNWSLPAGLFARTASCSSGSWTFTCPTPQTVFALLLEHRIEYGCGWPEGWAAREALRSIRAVLALRKVQLTSRRAQKWHRIVLDELDAAADADAAWQNLGVLAPNKAGLEVQYRVGRAIRLLHWSAEQLFEVSKAEKWGLTAVSWYVSASRYNAAAKAGADPAVLARAQDDLRRADKDFFNNNVYRAWGRYRQAWQRVTGLL